MNVPGQLAITLSCLLLFGAWLSAAEAQGPSSTTATYGDWLVQCNKIADVRADKKAGAGYQCEMAQVFTVPKTGQQLARLAIGKPNEDLGLTGVLHVPVGVVLAKPPQLQFGKEKALNGRFVRCTPAMCIASFALDAKQLKSVKDKNAGSVVFLGADAKPIRLSVSGNGFQDAMAAAMAK